MLDTVLNLFEIVPAYDLNIMKQGHVLFNVTSNVLLGIEQVLWAENSDAVLAPGDSITTRGNLLGAIYLQIQVGYVKLGIRTHDIYSPFPE